MGRPVTLFSGQWADLPFDTFCAKAKAFGYDGVEIACWGDHFEVDKALSDDGYVQSRLGHSEQAWIEVLRHQHASRRAVRVRSIPSTSGTRASCPRVCGATAIRKVSGNGPPKKSRTRRGQPRKFGVKVVNGFTGSKIWKTVAMFPPVSPEMIEAGYQDFADRWNPILDVFDEVGVKYALEVHPVRNRVRLLDDRARCWTRSAIARPSASTSIPATSTGRCSIRPNLSMSTARTSIMFT